MAWVAEEFPPHIPNMSLDRAVWHFLLPEDEIAGMPSQPTLPSRLAWPRSPQECATHDVLQQRAAELSRLAAVGMVDFQIEVPSVYCRPAGVSSASSDDFVVYQAAIVMPGGIGAVIWDANEYHEHANRPYGEPVNLAPRCYTAPT